MLHDAAQENQIVCATLPNNSTISTLHGLLRVLTNFGIIVDSYTKNMESTRKWLATETASWVQEVPLEHNIAKQLALHAAGKVLSLSVANGLRRSRATGSLVGIYTPKILHSLVILLPTEAARRWGGLVIRSKSRSSLSIFAVLLKAHRFGHDLRILIGS